MADLLELDGQEEQRPAEGGVDEEGHQRWWPRTGSTGRCPGGGWGGRAGLDQQEGGQGQTTPPTRDADHRGRGPARDRGRR